MTPQRTRRPDRWWALLLVVSLGFWAGGAAAQSSEGGGWFEGPEDNERPLIRIHSNSPRDVPPPDFQADTPPAPARDLEQVDEYDARGDADAGDELEDPDAQRRAVEEFSPRLAPYGSWVEDPFYGRVWVPSRAVVGVGFRPYVSGGHWELTTGDEWLWVSDYPFGWITFHYGRWAWLSAGGWGWIPGSVYAPAWVDFRIGADGYLGWGPAPPFSVWRGGVFVSLGMYRPVPYIFCPTPYVFSRSLPRYIVHDRHRVRSIAAHSHRYRPRYLAGSPHRVRGPSPREARIPRRYVPTRRVAAEPRVLSERRVIGQPRRGPGGSALSGPREYRDYQKFRAAPRSPAARESDRARPPSRSPYRTGGDFSRSRATVRVPDGRWRDRPSDLGAQERRPSTAPRVRQGSREAPPRWRGEARPPPEVRSNQGRAPAARSVQRAPAARSNAPPREVRERRGGSSRPARAAPSQQRSRRPER